MGGMSMVGFVKLDNFARSDVNTFHFAIKILVV
jgi:hypothetical protein